MTPNFILSSGTYKVWKFPSGEIGVQLGEKRTLSPELTIKGSITSSDHLMELLQLVAAIRSCWKIYILYLVMPYCAYSRQDRRCNPGESFSLKVFADLINSCNFTSVTTYDNHSDVSTALLNNCRNVHVKDILHTKALAEWYHYFISPDAGANKKVFECSKHFVVPMIRADKVRDTSDGSIISTDIYATSDQLEDSTVLIIDDICQGGRTFGELAKAIKAISSTCTVHLYVTHGFFSHKLGLDELREAGISRFITTDSVFDTTQYSIIHDDELKDLMVIYL